MAYIRTFICFEIPSGIRNEIRELQAQLKPLGLGVRWVNPDGIHLTLKFLGDVKEDSLTDIDDAVRRAVTSCHPAEITVKGAGAFPNFRNPRVYWIGVNEPTGEMVRCQQAIETELEELGYEKEKRRFSPHLTIGRIKETDGIDSVSNELQTIVKEFGTFTADKVIVMKSELKPSGAVYTPLYHINI